MAHRPTSAAPTTGASTRRPTIMRSRSTDGRSASEMPRKMTRSAPRTPSQLPKVLVTVGTARRLAWKVGKCKYSCLLGIRSGESRFLHPRRDAGGPQRLIADVFQRHGHDFRRAIDGDVAEKLQSEARRQIFSLSFAAALLIDGESGRTCCRAGLPTPGAAEDRAGHELPERLEILEHGSSWGRSSARRCNACRR